MKVRDESFSIRGWCVCEGGGGGTVHFHLIHQNV